ncbi:hypothetical protein KCK05_002634 [Salmonella enterica]|nr:hypothetical protein [Salmonella enterica]EHK1847750.1 hypothetical protein [Salmonella enterica]EHK1995793.1 hypothetical protein [Salmonella enterica]EHN5163468.1 hypothetical protein [Salmonella enterica]
MTVLFYLLKIIMIVRPQQHWIRLIFVWHGSVLSKIFSRLLLNFLLSIAVIIMLPWYTMLGIKFTLAPFSILGVAIAIFLGFGTENNDLPLDAICNAIEIDLLQMNDERDIPEKRIPDKRYQLT